MPLRSFLELDSKSTMALEEGKHGFSLGIELAVEMAKGENMENVKEFLKF